MGLPPLPGDGDGHGLQSIHLIARSVSALRFLVVLLLTPVFTIGRSQSAFLNTVSERHLLHTIAHSHGVSLRPRDPKCKPFVCRIRRVEDDAKSGVGAQRGSGLHQTWVKQHQFHDRPHMQVKTATHAQRPIGEVAETNYQQPLPGFDQRGPLARTHTGEAIEEERTSADSANTASTDSDFFAEHFPRVRASLTYCHPILRSYR